VQLLARGGIQKQRTRAPCQDVVNRARHLFAGGINDLRGDVGKARVEQLGEFGFGGGQRRDCDRIGAIRAQHVVGSKRVVAPCKGRRAVTHGRTASRPWAAAASTTSSAILRYVVHFPPAIEISPRVETSIACSRESFDVDAVPTFWTSGRSPANVAVMSARPIGRRR
jgi:hypothetical protein